MINKRPILEYWSIVGTNDNPYQAPELSIVRLYGKVADDERYEDGTQIYTSRLDRMHFDADGEPIMAYTAHNIYRLGKPNPEFVRWMKAEGHTFQDYSKAMGVAWSKKSEK